MKNIFMHQRFKGSLKKRTIILKSNKGGVYVPNLHTNTHANGRTNANVYYRFRINMQKE